MQQNSFHDREYDPYRLSSPRIMLLSMVIFLIIVAFLAAILFRQISLFFVSNPGLNGVIFGVLLVGIILAFSQILRLMPEIRWVNSFRDGTTEELNRAPVLLAPMRALIGRRQSMALSTTSMRSILDSIATRLDESRDISRYLIGLLVFLGLLGTFWGLLETVGSIGRTIQSLDPGTGGTNDILDALKAGLQAPLSGMGTAFSSSLFGLSGSLILGFLDLQTGRAQNRFYTELENWLSSITDVGSDLHDNELALATSEDLRLLGEHMRTVDGTGSNPKTNAALVNLAEGIQGLIKNMRSEQQMVREWMTSQSEQQQAMRKTLEELSAHIAENRRNDNGRGN